MIRVADYIMGRIYDEGVRHLFYVPGGQCVYLTDALRRKEGLLGVSVHHEQAAAMAALTYSLYNENFGACLVTTGCAGTNTVTGVLHAWQDSIPCIFVSGQQNLNQTIAYSGLPLRQVGIQEADIVTIVSSITKYAVMITDPKDIAYHLDKAIYLAREGRPGPVWIDVPVNIQNMMVDENKLHRYIPEETEKLELKEEELQYLSDAFMTAKRPVILAGEGIRRAGAVKKLRKFIDERQIPTVFSRFAADMLPFDHPLNFGVVGAGGAERNANFTIQNADLVLSIGCRLAIEVTGPEREQFAREANIIVVDIDAVEHSKKGVRIDRFIHMDAGEFLDRLLSIQVKKADSDWTRKCQHWKAIFPPYGKDAATAPVIDIKYFLEKMSEKLPDGAVVLSDAGLTGAVTTGACHLKEGQRAIASLAQGEMGYVLPAAVGVAPICDSMVVAVSGDGSIMMNLQEFQTVVRNQFNIKTIIMNNNGYSGVRHGQKAHFRGKSIGTDPTNGIDFPDYGKIAAAFGIDYCKIEKVEEIQSGIDHMLATDKPFICEVMCDPEQVDLHNALVMYGKRRFGFRPIEDQSPFIDRDTFFREMIVEPMETSYGEPV